MRVTRKQTDTWAILAFDKLIHRAARKGLGDKLYTVAVQASVHEDTIRDGYADALEEATQSRFDLQRNKQLGSFRPDVKALRDEELVLVVEVKAPMTNHDGVPNKTRKAKYLPKDARSLRAALSGGAVGVYELVALIECYPMTGRGEKVPHGGLSIRAYESKIKSEFGIKWPTRHDYEPSHGEDEVDETLIRLGMDRMRGWTRIELPRQRADVRAFLDCGLFTLH